MGLRREPQPQSSSMRMTDKFKYRRLTFPLWRWGRRLRWHGQEGRSSETSEKPEDQVDRDVVGYAESAGIECCADVGQLTECDGEVEHFPGQRYVFLRSSPNTHGRTLRSCNATLWLDPGTPKPGQGTLQRQRPNLARTVTLTRSHAQARHEQRDGEEADLLPDAKLLFQTSIRVRRHARAAGHAPTRYREH
jgi:hypothetical protein